MTTFNDNIPVFNDTKNDQSPEHPFSNRYKDIQEVKSSLVIKKFIAVDTHIDAKVTLYYYEQKLTEILREKIEKTLEDLTSFQHTNIMSITDYEVNDYLYWAEEITAGIPLSDTNHKIINPIITKSLINNIIDVFIYIHQYQIIGKLGLGDVFIKNEQSACVSFVSIILDQVGQAKNVIRPPEQKSSQSFHSKYADIYIIGVLIENILSRSNFANKSAVNQIIYKAKHDEPSKRFHDLSKLKTEFNKEFKHNTAHFWFSGSRAIYLISSFVFLILITFFNELIVDSVADFLPKSEDEQLAIQQSSQIKIEELQNKLSSYSKKVQKLKIAKNKLVKSRQSIELERSLIIAQVLNELDHLLSEKDSLLLAAELHAIETLHKEKHFEKAILQSESYSEKVDIAYNFAFYGEDVLRGNKQLDIYKKYHPDISKQPEIIEELALINKQLNNKVIAGLYENHISPLIERYQDQIQLRETNSIAQLVREIEINLVKIPSGVFKMGVKKSGYVDTKPVHEVEIPQFYVSKYEVTIGIFNQYLALSNKKTIKGNEKDPVTNISWLETVSFISWLSDKSKKNYRLLSESEWEYVAKANLKSTFPWGNSIKKERAQCTDCLKIAPKSHTKVGSFKENQFGLYDINGNVWEWTQDCYKRNYSGVHQDGTAYIFDDCQRRVIRGGAWNSKKVEMHPSYRTAAKPDYKSSIIGFRIAW